MASISRFGRATSSGSSASDNSFASSASVSSAVRSSRVAKSDGAVPVVIKNSSRSGWPDNRLWHRLRQFRRPGRWRLKSAGKSRMIVEISFDAGPLILPAPDGPKPEASNLRIARNLLLILLVVLLLPYLVAPLYRAGHPVSTLMAWRWLTGAPMSRPWVDFSAISPFLPRSVVASEDAKFCSHHGIDWDALRDVIDDAEAGEVARGGPRNTPQMPN